ncbi:hypothetical protein HYY69_05645 [Candidatus Woesearchaeota archaeon]|nr:hypothetical protein [Candidatus Woesearchaeota archaeon]
MKTMISSNILDQLLPEMKKAADIIIDAIESRTPIIVRHHLDSDGYTGGVALERAILPLVNKKHTRERDAFYYFRRLPCKAPFYSQEDALRDISTFTDVRGHAKAPVIIICDNGSCQQDIDGIKLVKLYGATVLVVDHHPPSPEIDTLTGSHINPHKVGSTYDYCTGMLCSELAHLVNPHAYDLAFIAAVGGVADRVESDEFKQYLKLAEQIISKEHIYNTAECLDYLGFLVSNAESREIVTDILNPKSERNLPLLHIFRKQLNQKKKLQLESNIKYHKVHEQKDKIIAEIDIDKVKNTTGFPPRGKTTGMLHDWLKTKHKKPVITCGYTKTGISFRCSTEIKNFDVNQIIALLQKKFPEAQVDGGGHRVAGSINFIEASREEVIKEVLEYCKRC